MSTPIDVMFLRDTRHGGDATQPGDVARRLAAFADAALHTLDVAIYDFRLSADLAAVVVGALLQATARGVTVRIAYDAGKPAEADQAVFTALAADPAPVGTAAWVRDHFSGTAVQTRAITAPSGQLMHSKYVVRDSGHRGAAVWTGSANWTDDAWNYQENNLLTITSAPLATGYQSDFDQLWAAGEIQRTGAGDAGSTRAGTIRIDWDFAPAGGAGIDAYLVKQVQVARTRIVLASMVITSHPLLAALATAIERGTPVSGVYDAGQMGPIAYNWEQNPHATDTVAHWKLLKDRLVGKQSVPYTPTGVHDFLHDKILVTDTRVATGSYNLSANAQHNSENQVHIADQGLADRYSAYIADLVAAYQ